MNNRIYRGVQRRYLSQRFSKALGRHLLSKRLTYTLIFAIILLGGNTQPAQSSEDALFIDANGRVGIGTNKPQSQLDVAGDAGVKGNTTVDKRLDVKGDTKVGGKLDVTGNSSVKGNTTVDKRLDVKGDTKVGGKLDVKGNISSHARYQRNDEPESSYEISSRYHLSLTGAKDGWNTKTIPQNVLKALCADPDGCEVRLANITPFCDTSKSVSFLFYYSKNGHWHSSETATGAATSGVDGNNRVESVMDVSSFACFLADGFYDSTHDPINHQDVQKNDRQESMHLGSWHKHKYSDGTCECTIID
ncbi:MAG: hypothetical protein LWX55_04135 [Deltaproteobacteria bacterium]|nr:hypothetical protein [Deltaproteobacteria bacterium]